MTHPVYSARILSAKGLVRLRKIAKELGVTPADGRTIQSHVDAIIQYQANKFQVKVKVKLLPTAVIGFDSESFESSEAYIVVSGGQIVERFGTYAQAERYCFGKYNIANERSTYEILCQIGNDHLHPDDSEDNSVQSFEEYLENLVFDDSEDEVIDDYLFHDEMERGSGRDKVPQFVAV
jgi:hypothetical protein